MSKHTITLPSGRAVTINAVIEVHQIVVRLNDYRTGYVITDLTTNHTFADPSGAILTFETPEAAAVMLGAMLVARYGMSLASALKAVTK